MDLDKIKLSAKAAGLKPGRYRHFKGDDVFVSGVGLNSETLEEYVIYKHGEHVWLRPLDMFLGTVDKDGRTIKRFEYLGAA